MAKPIILTTCEAKAEYFSVRKAYADAINIAGGEICIIPPTALLIAEKLISVASGLLLTGGGDIHPHQYGEAVATHNNGTIDKDRFVLEEVLIREALQRGIPILGICRGLQAINVYFEGTLYQDISTEIPGAVLHDTDISLGREQIAHKVLINDISMLAAITEAREISVNSLHHQAIKKVGDGLRVSAHAEDGLIEAVEHPDYPFLVGVQWHPEELDDEPSRRLFQALLTMAIHNQPLNKQILVTEGVTSSLAYF